MAPIKLEDHIREQFEEREIAPSAGAWGKLEAKLDKEEGKKRPAFIWYAIAASVVGVALITSQFFFNGEAHLDTELVEIEGEKPTIETQSTSEILKVEAQLAETKKVISEKTEPVINREQKTSVVANNANRIKEVQQINRETPAIENVQVAVQENNKSSTDNISEVINKDIVFNTKVNEVVAAVKDIQKENNAVSMAEIDALLIKAQNDIATDRILNETKIDAMALLNDVEFDLEKSFRDRVFYALGDGFSIIKTAVVERNN